MKTGTLKRKPGSGRKKTSDHEDRVLTRLSVTDRFKNAEDVRSEFCQSEGDEINTRRRLKKANFMASEKKCLIPKMLQKRIKCAKIHESWTVHDRSNAFFLTNQKNPCGSDGMSYKRFKFTERSGKKDSNGLGILFLLWSWRSGKG